MADIRFEFDFRPATDGQVRAGILASMNVSLWAGNRCIMDTSGWYIRAGKNGGPPWATPPSSSYVGVGGAQKYKTHIFIFPRKDGADQPMDEYKDWQASVVQAYNAWVAKGCPTKSYGNSQAPAYSAPQAAPAPQGPMLPQGWISNVDPRSGARYYQGPRGEVLFDGDPMVAQLLAAGQPQQPVVPPVPAPAPPAQRFVHNNPFAPPIPNRG